LKQPNVPFSHIRRFEKKNTPIEPRHVCATSPQCSKIKVLERKGLF
jgi:hypothetical protein